MQSNNTLTIVLVGVAAFLAFALYKRSVAAQAAIATPTVTGGAAVVGSIQGGISSVVSRVPYVGGWVNKVTSSPITNVESGNIKGTVLSIASGGISDWF